MHGIDLRVSLLHSVSLVLLRLDLSFIHICFLPAEEKDQDATIKTEDGDDMVIMENDEELIADDVESIKVEEKKKVPEIYSEDLPAKTDGAKRKQPGKHIEKLLKCKICNSLCTRGVSVACCGTQETHHQFP